MPAEVWACERGGLRPHRWCLAADLRLWHPTLYARICSPAGGLVWYTSYSPATFDGAAAFCAAKRGRVATFAEYCGSGAVLGGKTVGDHWAPYSGDGDNQWVQVGTFTAHPECQRHSAGGYQKPYWGDGANQALGVKGRVLCALSGQSPAHWNAACICGIRASIHPRSLATLYSICPIWHPHRLDTCCTLHSRVKRSA